MSLPTGTCAKASSGWEYSTNESVTPHGVVEMGLYTYRKQLDHILGLATSVTLGVTTSHDGSMGAGVWREGMARHAILMAYAVMIGLARLFGWKASTETRGGPWLAIGGENPWSLSSRYSSASVGVEVSNSGRSHASGIFASSRLPGAQLGRSLPMGTYAKVSSGWRYPT
ncbi:hypothetical protein B296_00036552 [Ensete ventricosum]|uniref:Uncharacterized protein n=1 Tax=Ensete ventricosum TaxID=4639 RepID=A0A426YED2_ENSVE|nr:hypothetical protein B296_00036552 [Ensete ventricosum]